MSEVMNEEFDRKINCLSKSNAYLNYCKEVYGYEMYLFNMMDQEQLDYVFNSISLDEEDSILDLGCGCGSLLNALTLKKGCDGVGVDQLHPQTMQISNPRVHYIRGNIDDFSTFDLHPTVTLLIDSIYFCSDMEKLVLSLSKMRNNRTYIFYSQYLFDENIDQASLQKDNTEVAKIFRKHDLIYDAIDFSNNERLFYEKSLSVLEAHRSDFLREGLIDLYEEKIAEQQLGKSLYENGRASRYLYSF